MTEHVDEPSELDLPVVLAALADPGRLSIVRALSVAGEAPCGEVQRLAGLDCCKSTMSHHSRVLREAGVTRTRISGTRRYVSLRRDDLQVAFPGLLDAVLTDRQPARV
jgi:DNA-binding transcriptional ArsR family regulator